ncbi:MAG: hypothetical protein OZ922_04595 [Myxococcales bacterium]|jgi:L-fucose isomerase-like protein|nr:hypothetical protein [Myxococcales bacterium]
MQDEAGIAAAVEAGTDGIAVPEALVEDPTPGKAVEASLLLQLQTMGVSEKIKLALRGNREARMLLIRDPNKMIRRFVLQNPRIGDEEVIAVAKNRSADDELLRMIGESREWTKNYQVRVSLVTNPKTPLVLSLRFLGGLNDRDVRMLAKSKNVSATVATAAKRIVQQKTGGQG